MSVPGPEKQFAERLARGRGTVYSTTVVRRKPAGCGETPGWSEIEIAAAKNALVAARKWAQLTALLGTEDVL